MNKIKVGFTIGDINGIGIEILLKVCKKKKLLEYFTPILFGSIDLCNYYKKILNIKINNIKEIKKFKNITDYKINVFDIWKEKNKKFDYNKIDNLEYSSIYSFLSIKKSVEELKNRNIDVLITSPVNKKIVNICNSSFIGHTEYLQNIFKEKSLMIMVYDKIRIAFVTNHVPIKEISSKLTKNKIKESILILKKSLSIDFSIENPKIAVLSFNPHSGDSGLIGDEEENNIKPVIKNFYLEKKWSIFGPYPSDSFFGNKHYMNFDAILAMYHDQGLIPFKMLSDNRGVNFTAGISYVRTSPCHGVAYDIVKKGVANSNSLEESIFRAIKIFRNRKKYKQ